MSLEASFGTAPDSLQAQNLSLRPEEAADEESLRELYIRHRWAEFAPLPWPDAQKAALIAKQFALQQRQHRANWPQSVRLVVTGTDGIAGRLHLAETADNLHIIDILLDVPLRGQGTGSSLIGALIDRAGASRTLTLSVDKNNPAQNLYRRLGFVEAADLGQAWQMRRPMHAQTSSAAR